MNMVELCSELVQLVFLFKDKFDFKLKYFVAYKDTHLIYCRKYSYTNLRIFGLSFTYFKYVLLKKITGSRLILRFWRLWFELVDDVIWSFSDFDSRINLFAIKFQLYCFSLNLISMQTELGFSIKKNGKRKLLQCSK